MTFQKQSQKAFEIYELSRTALSFALRWTPGLQFGCANGAHGENGFIVPELSRE